MKKFLSKWQGLSALMVAVALFFLSPKLLHWIDPTAGTFDAGYLQRPLVAACYFFFATACAWFAFTLDFPTLDQWLDANKFKTDWDDISSHARVGYIIVILALLIGAFLVCVWLVPV